MDRALDATLLHTLRVRLLQDYPGQLNACLDALDDEQLWWRPNEQANAAGNLVLHLAGSNMYYLGDAIGGRAWQRDRDAEFARRGGASKADVRQVWDDAQAVVAEVLNGLQPSQLTETTERTGKTTTFAQILLHVSHHNAMHLGQLLWITKLVRPGVLNDLGRTMRQR
jgi:uncharacterized damage-inducible protein DinB